MIKKLKNKKYTFNFIELISIIIVSLFLGAIVGNIITYDKENIVFNSVPEELDEFVTTYNTINNSYYKKISKDKLVDAAIEGMLSSLDDPYSEYMNKTDSTEFNETVNGEYDGIGITIISDNDEVKIVSVFDNSPAKKIGLKAGDKITAINDGKVANKNTEQISKLIKNSKKVKIKVIRDNEEKEYTIKKGTVDIPSVTSKMIDKDNKIGYISISIFSSNTYKEFNNALEKLEKNNMKALVIDVRNNPGGHLDQVSDIIDLFLNKNDVMYQIKNNKKKKKVYATTNSKRKYKIDVLINKNSASASEILAAALKDSYNSSVVGVNSYGKGSVQKQYKLANGSSIKYTVKKWYTPKGESIDKKGVEPTEVIEQSEDYFNNPSIDNDTQLQKAIEIVK